MSGILRLDQEQLKRLTRKSDRQMAKEQHPESADIIIKMQAHIDRLENRIKKLEQENGYRGSQMDKLMAEKILEGEYEG